MPTLLIHIAQNIALLFALTYGYSLLWLRLKRLDRLNHYLHRVTIGVLFGIIAVLAMLDPIPLAPGSFMDGRNVMITLVGVIEGPLAALVAAIIVIVARLGIGGTGTYIGVSTALTTIAISWVGRYYLKGHITNAKPGLFLALGVALIVSGALWSFLTASGPGVAPLGPAGLLSAVYYPLATLLLGELLVHEVRRQRTQSALVESELRFSKVFEASPVAISISQLNSGKFVLVNDALLKMIGFGRDELIGHTADELHTRTEPSRDDLVNAVINGQASHVQERLFRPKSGEYRYVEYNAERIELDGVPHILALISDITERKKTEAALESLNAQLEQRIKERTAQVEQEQMFLQTIMNSMGEGVMYSSRFVILYVNRAMEVLTGYSAAELIGKPNSMLQSDHATPQEAHLFHEEFVEPDAIWRGEARIRRKDGSEFQAALIVRRLINQYDRAEGAVTLYRDLMIADRNHYAGRLAEASRRVSL